MSGLRGIKAYLSEQENYEKTGLSEPDRIVDELIDLAGNEGYVLQEKETVKDLVGTDLRRQLPPQMLAAVSSVIRLIEKMEDESSVTVRKGGAR